MVDTKKKECGRVKKRAKIMDTTASLLTSLTLASIITTSGLTINLTENFGTLASDLQIKKEVNGDKLMGSYGNAVTGMSGVVIGLSIMYAFFFGYGWYKTRHNKFEHMQRIYWLVIILAIIVGIASAGVNLNLTDQYGSIDSLETSPNPVIPGENYKLRGPYGTATLGMAIASLVTSSTAFLWMVALSIQNWNKTSYHRLEH